MGYGYQIYLKMGVSSYDVKALSYAFDKQIDDYGDVASPVEGGLIHLSLADLPQDALLSWAIARNSYKNGVIQMVNLTDGANIGAEEIEFKQAACTNMKLIFEREHTSYFTTLLTISPRQICIGRNNCWINKPWTIEETESEDVDAQGEAVEAAKDALLPKDTALEGELIVAGKTYELYAFETEFVQPNDYKGQPQSEVKGGLIMVQIRQQSDEVLNKWMFEAKSQYSGLVQFVPVSRYANAPIQIVFKDAKCISFEKMAGPHVGILIRLVISAEEIKINQAPHSNKYANPQG